MKISIQSTGVKKSNNSSLNSKKQSLNEQNSVSTTANILSPKLRYFNAIQGMSDSIEEDELIADADEDYQDLAHNIHEFIKKKNPSPRKFSKKKLTAI